MKIFSLFRNWFARTVGNDPRKRQILYAWSAALFVIFLMAAPALAQSGITFYTGLGVVNDGTAAAPSWTFFSDVDTGLYRIGANNLGVAVGGSNVLDVGTSGLTVTGAVSASSITNSGGQANSSWVNIAAPTAIGSATPALVVNSAGVSNLFEARKNATPVFSVSGAGNTTIGGTLGVTGLVTINGVKCYKGQQAVLGAATAIPATLTAAGITTPTWANQNFAASPGDTYWTHSHTIGAGVVTFNTYQRLLSGTVTPQAATTTVALDYEICGN